MLCNLCPRKCNALRTEHVGKGFCGMGTLPVVARVAPHFGEEPCISGKNGSGTVFFSGCTMHCMYCQNYEISVKNKGTTLTLTGIQDLDDPFYGDRTWDLGVLNWQNDTDSGSM
ncbi:MAG: hypothetical protein II264_09630, partial [Ruminococcus sp.]|nr:hypothetical protein [Ruminococcus sp.]